MLGEHLIADDVADEIVTQATLKLPREATDAEVAQITIADWKRAIVQVLYGYGAKLRDDVMDDRERDGEAEFGGRER